MEGQALLKVPAKPSKTLDYLIYNIRSVGNLPYWLNTQIKTKIKGIAICELKVQECSNNLQKLKEIYFKA